MVIIGKEKDFNEKKATDSIINFFLGRPGQKDFIICRETILSMQLK